MKKKLIIMISMIFAIVIIAIPAFAWFYFPNSKGVEINTPDAEDVNVKLYKLFYYYDENGIFDHSTLEDLTNKNYENSNGQNVSYLTQDGYQIPTSFEFFEWGDEYICEDDTTDYYVMECDYDSDAFNDGYVKSLLTTTLKSIGGIYNYGSQDEELKIAFPIVNISYKFASSYQTTKSSYISELQSESNYKLITDRYYIKDNTTYKALDAATYNASIDKIYKRNLTEFTGNSFVQGTTYYKYEHVVNQGSVLDNGIFQYVVADNYVQGTKYYTGTFDEVTGLDVTYGSDSTYRYKFTDVHTDVFNTLNKTQYVNNNKLKFTLLIKVEPNTELVTNVMNVFRDDVKDDFTEINIDNEIEFKVNIRSIPKKEA